MLLGRGVFFVGGWCFQEGGGVMLNRVALRVVRERSGLSVSELARRSGVSQPHLSNIEVGRRGATQGVAVRLAAGLLVPLAAIWCECDRSSG